MTALIRALFLIEGKISISFLSLENTTRVKPAISNKKIDSSVKLVVKVVKYLVFKKEEKTANTGNSNLNFTVKYSNAKTTPVKIMRYPGNLNL